MGQYFLRAIRLLAPTITSILGAQRLWAFGSGEEDAKTPRKKEFKPITTERGSL
jgi:hypothetical protein